MALPHSKFKKRIKKRNLSFSSDNSLIMSSAPNQTAEKEEPPFHPTLQRDASLASVFSITSQKGHFTYYSKTPISSGDYYFEVEILSVDFDMISFIKSKCTDEVKKKYYEPLLKNIKNYQSTIRIGVFSTKSEMEIPIGALGDSYGYRSIDGALIKGGEYIMGNETFKTGDVVGCLVHLKPPKPDFLKMEEDNIIGDESYLKFYINGVVQKEIVCIKEGDYYLGATLFNYATANINFGKAIKYFPTGFEKGIKFICEDN